jgi:type IV pilus secretin PilQ/predicted competence protein
MAGMKIRFGRVRNIASSQAKGMTVCILLFLLAFAIPQTNSAQETPKNSKAAQLQSTPTPLSTAIPAGKAAKDAPAGQAAAITDVKIAPEADKLTVTVTTDRLLTPNEFALDNPSRLVLDFPNTENKARITNLPVHALMIKQLRVQQFQSTEPKIARIVFDCEVGYGPHEVTSSQNAVQVVFRQSQTAKASPKPAAPAARPETPKTGSTAQTAPAPSNEPALPAAQLSLPAVEHPKAASAGVLKTLPVAPAVKESSPAFQATAPLRPELPKAPVVPVDQKVRLAETPVKNPVPTPPLIAALAPASLPAAPRPVTFNNSRFSGQPLTLDLVDIALVDFFRLMAEEGGVNIVMDPEVKGRISIKVVKVPWDQIFEAALANNGLDKQVEGSLVRIARKATLQDEAKQQESLKKANLLAADVETRIRRLNYAKAASFINALNEQKTVRGTVVVEERTNSLILTDLPKSLDKMEELIGTLDIPQPQVEIEARIVSATRDFARDIGVQLGFVQGNLQRVTVGGPNTFGTIGGTRPSATPSSTYAAGNPITGRGAADSSSSESAGVSTGASSNNKGNWNVNLPAQKAFGGLGISVGNIFDTFLLDAAITAGESKGLAKLISQPKVTAQNNSPAVITQGLRFPVQIIANNTIAVQFQNAALTLTVTPQITYEGNIVLDLKVENNTPDFGRQVNGIPSIRTSESTTRVLVSDGGTTVIGGILIDNEATQEDKVPGLGSLPVIGNLFKRNSVSRSTQEVLFFVTPRVIK